MGRFSAAFRATSAGTATLPAGSLYAPAGNRLILREVHIVNTTATETTAELKAFTATGTQGAAITEIEYDNEGPTPTGTAFNTHTVTPTITAGEYGQTVLAAAIGAAWSWMFHGEKGILIPAGTGNGVGILVPSGTGQIMDITFVWDE
jgi:hypothetical protein